MLNLPGLPIYWTPFDIFDLMESDTFEALFNVAHSVLLRMPQPVSMVCGPISSGGKGSREKNLIVFKKTIKELSDKNITIFSQMPFEEPMWRIQKTSYYKGGCHTLEGFYLPIFESGLVKRFYFIRGWESSLGATWEHTQAKRLGIEIVYL
ncbi:MAG: hypothetical protein ACYC3G_04230 [Minisyncoccota bacterium]